ncbi:hypothetical protein SNOUR_25965 [Streptomyces noursei ATCC 11455]|nr:hypothetical protein SNOUR_25965 [Streptomyces noursei ATCC 11455]
MPEPVCGRDLGIRPRARHVRRTGPVPRPTWCAAADRILRRGSRTRTGNRYDDRMVDRVVCGVSEQRPGVLPHAPLATRRSASTLLGAFGGGAARLHVDLCRLSSAICPRCAAR